MKHRYTTCHRRLMEVLTAAREAAGLTQRDLSDRLKRAHNFSYYVESGQRELSVCEFMEYAEACGADPVKLLKRIRG